MRAFPNTSLRPAGPSFLTLIVLAWATHFAVLDSPVINAFAVPGGYIYVTRGALALMRSEAEMSVVQKKTASLESGKLVNERHELIHGLSCVHQTYDVAKPDKEALRVQFSFIKKGDHIYTLSALSTAALFKSHESEFSRIVNSFEELKDPKRLSRRPLRLKLVPSDGSQSLRRIFEKSSMPKDLWDKLAVMNGLGLNDVPPKDRLIKIVR